MKLKRYILAFSLIPVSLILIILSAVLLSGCSSNKSYEDNVKVVYELEGGVYRNCSYLTHYYDFEQGTENLICEPDAFTTDSIIRQGYTLEGWYTDKSVDSEGNVTYSGKWDFATDKVTDEGITLYAHWKKNLKLTYNVCYRDENDEVQILYSYVAEAGDKFNDVANYAKKRLGYTFLEEFVDEDGNPWDENFTFPEVDEDYSVNVFGKYIQGTYKLVRTAAELRSAKTSNIYLMNDIDFEGETFNGFGNYNKIFLGNGHKISNVAWSYTAVKADLISDAEIAESANNILCVSLFGNINGATIKDVVFENVEISIKASFSLTTKIFLAPICVKATDSTVENVTLSGSFIITDFPDDAFDTENNLVVVTDCGYYVKDDQSLFENVTLTVIYDDGSAAE